MSKVKIEFADQELLRLLFGHQDSHLDILEKNLAIKLQARGAQLTINGDKQSVELGQRVLKGLYQLIEQGYQPSPGDVEQSIDHLRQHPDVALSEIFLNPIPVSTERKMITPKSQGQKVYLAKISEHDIVFGIGPAGTGKTYLAMAMALNAFHQKWVKRIILTRPAVEAGEKLGFLPGDMYEKVNPYLRPLYDALYDMMEPEKAAKLIEKSIFEVAPLAFMRGRTLNNAFVILDEAQNCTTDQLKMLLTRLGKGSKVVVTGDVTQIDLPGGQSSGLVEIQQILEGVDGISFHYFSEADVVRHGLVKAIIRAFERFDNLKIKKKKYTSIG